MRKWLDAMLDRDDGLAEFLAGAWGIISLSAGMSGYELLEGYRQLWSALW
jgi:hypothetical protein